MTKDFSQWMSMQGINVDKQPRATEAQLIVLEALYDLIIDTRKWVFQK